VRGIMEGPEPERYDMNDDADKQTAENGSTASLPPSDDDDRDGAGRFAPGNPGGAGRPAGRPGRKKGTDA